MSIRYAILPADPGAHIFQVTVEVDQADPRGQAFRLPAWIPGSYMIRDFARNIVRLRALTADGRRVRVAKTDKHTWRCAPLPAGATLMLAYEVYAYDLSVRAAHLDTTHGFFNGSSVFLLPVGHEHTPCRVHVFAPRERRYRDWQRGHRAARGAGNGCRRVRHLRGRRLRRADRLPGRDGPVRPPGIRGAGRRRTPSASPAPCRAWTARGWPMTWRWYARRMRAYSSRAAGGRHSSATTS